MTTQVEEDQLTVPVTEHTGLVPAVPEPRRHLLWPVVGGSLVALGIVAGVVGRAWWITHTPIDSDQAVVGLMAREILHGHVTAFYWGQSYGGVEPFLVAAVFAVAGQNAYSLTVVPAVLMAATAVLTWRTALRLVEDRWLAALAGLLVWSIPMFGVTETTEYGFRNVTLAVGVVLLLMSLRILDGRSSVLDVAGFGLLVGVGWWASPEITFFLVPAGLLFAGALLGTWRTLGYRFWLPRIGVSLVGFGVGALPWLWSNIPDGFRSLDASKVTVAGSGGYLSHLHLFFVDVLPLQLGVHRIIYGTPLLPGALGLISEVLILGALVASSAVCLLQGGRGRAIAVGLLAFPFLYALDPLGWFWYDGRYSIYLSPLAALVFVMGCERIPRLIDGKLSSHAHSRVGGPGRARRAARASVALLVVVALSSAAVGFAWMVGSNQNSVLTSDPNAAAQREIALLEQHGLSVGYANYWVSYKLDFLSGGALEFVPVPWDQVRSSSMGEQVGRAARPAWLFVPPAGIAAATDQFGISNLQPGFVHEAAFERSLTAHGVEFSIVHLGLFDAIVPRRTLTPRQAVFG
jgi:Dolichyl-phosphate-mannose-protein mannosyltransferase